MRVLDLFSGIGGFSLGLERAGMRTVAFCEIDPYCRAVIARHWPGVPIFGDIRELTAEAIRDTNVSDECRPDKKSRGNRRSLFAKEWAKARALRQYPAETSDGRIDLICGGFPCQDISVAGKGAGLAGARSGLWREYHRLIREIRPRYVIVENVSALLSRGLGEVLGDLAEIGYDAEWHCIPASYVGAPHRRDRVWIVCYPHGDRKPALTFNDEMAWESQAIADTSSFRCENGSGVQSGLHQSQTRLRQGEAFRERGGWLSGQWHIEPDVGRVAHGVPARVDRLRALGNSVVPQVVEIIGRAIMRMENARPT